MNNIQTNFLYDVEFISVSFSYQDFEVLEDVSLQVKNQMEQEKLLHFVS